MSEFDFCQDDYAHFDAHQLKAILEYIAMQAQDAAKEVRRLEYKRIEIQAMVDEIFNFDGTDDYE